MDKLMNEEIKALYERYGNGEITLEEREELIQELKDSHYKTECTSDIVLDYDLTPIEQFTEVKKALYEKCSNGEIGIEERETLIQEYYDEIFPTEYVQEEAKSGASAALTIAAITASVVVVAKMISFINRLKKDKKIKQNPQAAALLSQIDNETKELNKKIKELEKKLRFYNQEIKIDSDMEKRYGKRFKRSSNGEYDINLRYNPDKEKYYKDEKNRMMQEYEPIKELLKEAREQLKVIRKVKKKLYKLAKQSEMDPKEIHQMTREIDTVKLNGNTEK